MTSASSAERLRVAKAAIGLLLALALIGAAAAAPGPRQEKVQFATDASSAVIKGHLKGDADVDYVVRAAAGQTLSVTLKETNPQNYFNVLPPGSTGGAMFVGDTGEDYAGMLPSDGDYVVRVYLMRPAARRGESSDYTLTIGVTGKPLAPLPATQDALVPGTSYHATAKIKCVPAYETATKDCDAAVIRRGHDGTATLEVVGAAESRSILFVKGRPVASNASRIEVLSSERQGDVTVVKLGDSERYEVPDALLTGG
jgi:hypothetical protein